MHLHTRPQSSNASELSPPLTRHFNVGTALGSSRNAPLGGNRGRTPDLATTTVLRAHVPFGFFLGLCAGVILSDEMTRPRDASPWRYGLPSYFV